MKKIVRLTESDLIRLVNKVINEQRATGAIDTPFRVGDILSVKTVATKKVLDLEVTSTKLGLINAVGSSGKSFDLEPIPSTNRMKIVNLMGGNNEVVVGFVKRNGQNMAVMTDGTLRGMGLKM